MGDIPVFVKYNGQWGEHNVYSNYQFIGVLIPCASDYDGMLAIMFRALNIELTNKVLDITYVVEAGSPRISINNDISLRFYLQLKKTDPDKVKFPLCVNVIEDSQEGSKHQSHDPYLDNAYDSRSKDTDIGGWGDSDEEMSPARIGGTEIGDASVPLGAAMSRVNGGIASEDTSRSSQKEEEVLSSFSPTTIRVNGIYTSKAALQKHLVNYALSNHFQYKAKTSHTTVLHVVCIDDKCKWAVRATNVKGSRLFQIKRFDNVHTCSIDSLEARHPQATSTVVGESIKHKFLDPTLSDFRPRDIMHDMENDHGVHITYKAAWRAKEYALKSLRGSYEESYQQLPALSYMLEKTNPGSVVDIETDDKGHFLYYFFSLAAWIEGWPHVRPVIIVDGTHLKSGFGGTLLTACAMDANEQVFPLAFGLGDSENNNSWEWFLTKLKVTLAERDELAIISDRHEGILNGVKKVFPNAHHGYCMIHLLHNLKHNFKGASKNMNWQFINAAKAYTIKEWEHFMGLLGRVDSRIVVYLEKEVGFEKWARCHFEGRRYSMMTSNNAESVNAVGVKPRHLPVAKLVEWLRGRMQEWFFKRREMAAGTFTVLAKEPEKKMRDKFNLSAGISVYPASEYKFEAVDNECRRFIVNLRDRSCSCKEFQIDRFPCIHAMAACKNRGISCHSIVSNYYSKEALAATYAGIVHPIGDTSGWDIPDDVKSRIVLPPIPKGQTGRGKKRRIPSQGEVIQPQHCSRCGANGHNRKTCRSKTPLGSQGSTGPTIFR